MQASQVLVPEDLTILDKDLRMYSQHKPHSHKPASFAKTFTYNWIFQLSGSYATRSQDVFFFPKRGNLIDFGQKALVATKKQSNMPGK